MLTFTFKKYIFLKIFKEAKHRDAPWLGSSHGSYDTIAKIFQIEETLCKHLGMSHGHPAFITTITEQRKISHILHPNPQKNELLVQ